MNWTKNLSKILLPRSGQRSQTRYWQTLQDHANRDSYRHDDDAPDYAKALEDVRLSAVVMACVGWVATMLPRCPWTLERRVDGAWEPVDAHPILDLLASPTPWHGGPEMLSALIGDYLITGTAYWQRVGPTSMGPPKELWWRPSWSLYPMLNVGRTGLEGYVYEVDGKKYEWAMDDVVQVRNTSHGQNPANPWLGVSPLAALAPEVWINSEATKMTAALLKNLGQVGIAVIAKPQEDGGQISEFDAQAMKKYLREAYSGSNRGDSMFIEFPAEIHGGGLVDPDMMHPKAIFDYVQEMVWQHLPSARRRASIRRRPRGCDPERDGGAVREAGVGDRYPGRSERAIVADRAAAATSLSGWTLPARTGWASTRPVSRCYRRTARKRRKCTFYCCNPA